MFRHGLSFACTADYNKEALLGWLFHAHIRERSCRKCCLNFCQTWKGSAGVLMCNYSPRLLEIECGPGNNSEIKLIAALQEANLITVSACAEYDEPADQSHMTVLHNSIAHCISGQWPFPLLMPHFYMAFKHAKQTQSATSQMCALSRYVSHLNDQPASMSKQATKHEWAA